METIPVREKALIKKKCYDVINLETKNSKRFLKKSFDNILIIFGNPRNYNVECFKRSDVANIIKNRTSVKNCKKRDESVYNFLYPITISAGNFYLPEEDLKKILTTNHQIYYLEMVEKKGYICQGQPTDIYTIKVCGGKECLPKVFGPHQDYEKKEVQVNVDELAQVMMGDIDWSSELTQAIEDGDEDYFDRLLENLRETTGNSAYIIDNSYGSDLEPILVFAIKERAFNMVNMMLDEGASIEVEEEGITPLVASIFYTDGQDFENLIMSLFNLDQNLVNFSDEFEEPINVKYHLNKRISLRRSGRYDDIFQFLERYPDITDREHKIQFLREVYNRN